MYANSPRRSMTTRNLMQQAQRLAALAILTMLCSQSCGFGTAGGVAAVHGGDGGSNAPTTPGTLAVLGAKLSPATIRIVLTDPEGDPATVTFFRVAPGGGEVPLAQLAQNPVSLAT